jgi:GT2 family glycosyltransferase
MTLMRASGAASRLRIVVLGYIVRGPLGGLAWHYLQYVLGLSRLGHEVLFVEQNEAYSSCYDPARGAWTNDPSYGLAFADAAFRHLDHADCWAFVDATSGRWHGPDAERVRRRCVDADILLNVSGVTQLPVELHRVPVRVLIDTDPAFTQIRHLTDAAARRRADEHNVYFTFAENLPGGRASIPDDGLPWQPTRQPLVLDVWPVRPAPSGAKFTSVMLWESYEGVEYQGRRYGQKGESFTPFVDLPQRAGHIFELALGSPAAPGPYLQTRGWDVIDPLEPTRDLRSYQRYIADSKGEFGIAKHGYVSSRSGWFSERSACYLASGKPVIVQDTGFSDWLPCGEGLLPFTSPDDAVAAVAAVNERYRDHCEAARAIAERCFDSRTVLPRLLERAFARPVPPSLVLAPVSRRPTTLTADTVAEVVANDLHRVPSGEPRAEEARPRASIVIVTSDNFVFLKLCITSLLANTGDVEYELIVVDNGSRDQTAQYLDELAANAHITVIRNPVNEGFAPATNRGLAAATGTVLVLLNDDTVVPPGWLSGLCSHADVPSVGLVGPVTNKAGNECEIQTSYRTYGELLRVSRELHAGHAGELRDVPMLTMFCVAMRRDVFERLGPLDEQFVIGMFEDDDYAMRARQAHLRIACAEDVFVHHFGGTSLGKLASSGELKALFEANRRRFEQKWGVTWTSRRTRVSPEYEQLVQQIRAGVARHVAPASVVAVVSRGDDALIDLADGEGWHFPRAADGAYAGHHPATSDEAIERLNDARDRGADYLLIPQTMRWWMDFYREFADFLQSRCRVVADTEAFLLFALHERAGVAPSPVGTAHETAGARR